MSNPFRYFNSSPEVIRLVGMMYVRYPLSLRNVEDLLHERGIDISHETVRFWWNRFGPIFVAEIRKRRVADMRGIRSGGGIWMRCSWQALLSLARRRP
jgi:putative transposase